MDLTGRVFLVTGASSGIGRESAVLLSHLGAKVVLVARDKGRLHATLESLWGSGHHAEAFDLIETERIPEWFKSICMTTGPLNGIVHCAGIQRLLPLRALNTSAFEEILKINVIAAAMLAKAFRQKGCCVEGGSIVFLSSVMGMVGEVAVSAYSASKSAVLGLTRCLALETAREKIRVNCVVPGYVTTEMTAAMSRSLSPDQLNAIESLHPLGFGQPRDVAHAIAFLLADTASWITGSGLVVDGGYTAR